MILFPVNLLGKYQIIDLLIYPCPSPLIACLSLADYNPLFVRNDQGILRQRDEENVWDVKVIIIG